MNRKKEKKKGVDIYSDLSYHLLLSFGWRLNHGLGGGNFMCMIGLGMRDSGVFYCHVLKAVYVGHF